MRSPGLVACLLLALTALPGLLAAADPPLVALRVDLEPLEPRGEATALNVVVQIAPEDRSRIGASAWVELDLRRGRETVERVSRAVEVDGKGQARLEVAWTPGAYELEVEIRSARGDARGLWTDRVAIPTSAPAPAPTPQPTARPTPPPVPTPIPQPAPHPAASPPAEVASPPAPAPPAAAEATPERELPPANVPAGAAAASSPVGAPPTGIAAVEPVHPAEATTVAPWSAPVADTAEVTVLVTRLQRPVTSLGLETMSLKVEGDVVPVLALGGPGTAPLSLALAVDLSSTMEPHLPELRRLLGQLALEVTANGGSVSLVAGDAAARRTLDWGAGPEDLAEVLRPAGNEPEGDLAGMVTAALVGLTDRPGRRLALVVSDGGDTAGRDGWRRAEEAAATAAAPVLVVELPGLEGRPASALDRLVDDSGGESFTAPTADMMGTVLRHYRDLLEATYAVRFRPPEGARSSPYRIRITTADDSLEVRYPKRAR